jgi:acyl dehydratase
MTEWQAMSEAAEPQAEVTTDLAGLPALVGTSLGHSPWTVMTQERIDAFAELTGDHNFIHVDPARASETPYGATIAHGFLTLSLLAPITQRLNVTDVTLRINYGLDRVRFPAPLKVGGRFRGTATVAEVTQIEGGAHVKVEASIEVEGQDKPAVAAECLLRFYR